MIRSKFNVINRLVPVRSKFAENGDPQLKLREWDCSEVIRVKVRWDTAKYSQPLFRHPLLWPRRVRMDANISERRP